MDFERLQQEDHLLKSYARAHVIFKRGKNATLWTNDGREFIDFGSGIGVCSVGHANPKLNAALKDQLENITHISNLYTIDLQAQLAKKITTLSNMDMSIFFSNSGAEANECAIKIARKHGEKTRAYKIITLQSSFHGRTIATLKATGQTKLHEHFGPFPDGFVIAKDLREISKLVDEQTCGVMLELIQGEGGVNAFDKEEIRQLASFLKQKEILLLIDEVQSGAYRSGSFLASQAYGIKPDIITMAKGLGGGIPIGATLSKLKDIFVPGDHGSTFGGNYLSMRAGMEVLDILNEEMLKGHLDQKITLFENKLLKILQAYPHLFLELTGMGLMRGLRTKSQEVLEAVLKHSLDAGLLVLKSGQNVLRFLPALTISNEEIMEGFKRLEQACQKIK